MGGFPNVPTLWTPSGHRKNAEALNHLLNQQDYINVEIAGVPSAGQVLLSMKFPFPVTIVPASSGLEADVAATSSASVTFEIGGSPAGSATFPALGDEAQFSLTTTEIPAWTRLRILAPTPQDATLADLTLALAII